MSIRTITAREVMTGDLIDLEHVGEPYVTKEDAENIYTFEHGVVQDYHHETPETIVIEFDSTTIAFPMDFKLNCAGNLGDHDKKTETR